MAQRAAKGEIGRFGIGLSGATTCMFMPDLLRKYKDRYPDVALILKRMCRRDRVLPSLPYLLQPQLMRSLAIPDQKAGSEDLLALWAGQSAKIAHCSDVESLLESLISGKSTKLS